MGKFLSIENFCQRMKICQQKKSKGKILLGKGRNRLID